MTPLARSSLALVFLWYAEPTMRHEPMPLAKARNTALVNLGSWSTTSTSGKPATGIDQPRGVVGTVLAIPIAGA